MPPEVDLCAKLSPVFPELAGGATASDFLTLDEVPEQVISCHHPRLNYSRTAIPKESVKLKVLSIVSDKTPSLAEPCQVSDL